MNKLYKQLKSKYVNMLAVILSFAIIFSSFGFPLVPTASAADPLPAPQNVKITGVTHKSVTLAWDAVEGVDSNSGYQVWYSNGGWAAWTGSPTVTVSGLNPNTSYSFYVTAITAANDRSVLVTAKTDEIDPNAYPEPPLTPPHNLVISDITKSEVKLSWTGSPGAAGYDMYVNNSWSAGIWNGSNTYTYPVPQTVTGSVYFEVAAQITPSDVSARSNRVTIEWGKLSKPKDLKIVSSTRSSVALGWAPTPGATEYDIYKGDSVIASTYSNRYVERALTEGESYDFKVVAKNKLWESPASDVVTAVPGSNYNIVTYYTSWARNPSERNYSLTDVDTDIGASKLTHINYAFADLCWKESGSRGRVCENPDIPLQDRYVFDGEMVLGDPTEDEINIRDLQALKTANPNLNLMISVGGRSWSKNFSNMANTEVNRRLFANSAVEFLRKYRFDGLDIDWEYPVAGGDIDNSRRPEDKQNYTLLMKTVREALDAAGSKDGKYYLLTIASYQGQSFVDNADLANSSQYIDFINIMTYDYSGNWNTSGYHNTPLFYDPASPSASAKHNNVNSSVAGHLNGGVPNHKLVLGVPFYGNGWTGCDTKGEYVPCEKFAEFGTWENGKFDIYDLENNYLTNTDYVRYWNESAKIPYLYNQQTGTFISYDDTESMMYKASLVKTLDLAGMMSWDITGDRNGTLSTQLANDLPIHGVVNANTLAAPQKVTSISTTDTTLSVGWDAVTGATGYDVFANKVWQGYTTATEFVIANLSPNSEYMVEVIALEKDGALLKRVSAMSKPLKEITNGNVPSIDLQPVDHSVDVGDSVTLHVGASTSDSGTLSYQWYSSETGSSYTAISDATSASYEAPTTTVGTTYYYVVVTNTNGNKTSQATSFVAMVEVTALYSVSFKDWDNTTLKTDPVNHGSDAIAPADPTRVGYTFTGWDAAFTNVTGDMTITAQYVVNKYTLSFESNGGSEVDDIEANYDSVLVEPAAPIKTGHRFEGWYKEAALTNKWSFATDKMPEGGTKLYANWTSVYSVAYDGNGSTAGSVPIDNTEYKTNEVVTVMDNINSLAKSGYSFAGWSTQPSGNGTNYAASTTFAISTDVILYANWIAIPYNPSTPNTTDTGMNILINGELVRIGTVITSKVNNKLVTTITLDQKKLEERLKNAGSGAVITLPASVKSDAYIFELSMQMVNLLQDSLATIVIQTDNASYSLPAMQINIQQVAAQFGEDTNVLDIRLQIEVAESTVEALETVKYLASQGNYTILVPPISFTVRAIYGDKWIERSKFNIYVERLIALPDGTDPNKVTTGVVVEQDGTVRHVPTKVILRNGKYYALINSMSNSTYSVIWHPLEFVDVSQHWAKAAIKDMGSRMVISGIGNNMFNPDQDITRAEFAAVIVRGLGLPLESGATSFKDLKESDWYSSAVQTAYSNGLINGYSDGTFRPKEKITREQAMLIIANAMKLTGLKAKLSDALTDTILNPFKDASDVSEWAKSSVADNIQSEIVSGKNDARLVPKSNITRAEVAVMIQRLLQKSDLI
ncbi:glycosyl hydrolase family 18 protein [Paenibacillus nasutitermitis]|uniref:chitinase n=1 Tax=Paenibacillus nasutitermitis TaxID=1652958 RepID=A0A916Z8Z0_9BACL|nr:glycosyl hydrolase family 18 protein [Paenibacillus nasutitermitis]GGD81825.1 hypothetical protein GCM10010911_44930 [Paenibacillus nasutitermitis]